MISILIVDDHPVLGAGTKRLIDQENDMKATFVMSGQEALQKMKDEEFDLFIYDMHLPELDGLHLARQTTSNAPILIYSGFDLTSYLSLLIQAGVVGIINKTSSPQQLIRSIRDALEGTASIPFSLFKQMSIVEGFSKTPDEAAPELIPLSAKEISILERVLEGKSNKELAELFYISQRTVEYHLTNIFIKLKVHSRAEAVVAAQKQCLLG
jgi:two-component system competent response regulator ComA